MQMLIIDERLARTRVLHFSRLQLLLAGGFVAIVLLLLSGTVYHFVFLKAARAGWPVVSKLVRLVVSDEIAQRDRFMRDNLDAIAQKVGEMQAKLVKLEVMSERVSDLAGMRAEELRPLRRVGDGGGRGGPYVPIARPSLQQLQDLVAEVDEAADRNTDIFTLIESRLFESRLQALLVPSTAPVDGPVGSGFGVRSDPISGRTALHTGLDFTADVGAAVRAAAGGVVQSTEPHPEYGLLVVLDHGSGLSTRYAHLSVALVSAGDLVRRGHLIGRVGVSGRSTGPHLHFEVLIDGAPQNPARFLAAAPAPRLGVAHTPGAAPAARPGPGRTPLR